MKALLFSSFRAIALVISGKLWRLSFNFLITLRLLVISDILLLFSTQAFWIGIFASVILVAGIVYVRSSNSDHAID